MASSAAVMTTTVKKDTRNLHWKSNNVGSKLLAKMGWKDGQAVGKRHRDGTLRKAAVATGSDDSGTVEEDYVSSEGMRVVKRQIGLGLGASAVTVATAASQPVQNFSEILAQLQSEHAPPPPKKKRKKSSSSKSKEKDSKSKTVKMPTNRITHQGIRDAKFKAKSQDDMKCIFGGVDFPAITSTPAVTTSTSRSFKKAKSDESKERNVKDEKKKSKKKKADKTSD